MNPLFTTTNCFKSTYNWGGTIIDNICAGTTNTIKWGSLDWTFYGLMYLAGAAFALSLAVAAVKAIVNYKNTDDSLVNVAIVKK